MLIGTPGIENYNELLTCSGTVAESICRIHFIINTGNSTKTAGKFGQKTLQEILISTKNPIKVNPQNSPGPKYNSHNQGKR